MLVRHIANNHPTGIIFIPGFLSEVDEFTQIVSTLNLPFTIYSVDLFSDYPLEQKLSYQDFLTSLVSKLDALPIKNKILVGYSLGARLAFGSYLKSPSKYSGLFLESFNPGIIDLEERAKRALADQTLAKEIGAKGWVNFLRRWYQNPIFAYSQIEQEVIITSKLKQDPQLTAKVLQELSLGLMPSYWEDLSLIDCPVTLINGESDTKFLEIAKKVQKILSIVQQVTVPGTGHNVHLQAPKQFTKILCEFLETIHSR